MPRHKKEFKGMTNDRFYTFTMMTIYILNTINDTFDFEKELNKLFEKCLILIKRLWDLWGL